MEDHKNGSVSWFPAAHLTEFLTNIHVGERQMLWSQKSNFNLLFFTLNFSNKEKYVLVYLLMLQQYVTQTKVTYIVVFWKDCYNESLFTLAQCIHLFSIAAMLVEGYREPGTYSRKHLTQSRGHNMGNLETPAPLYT